MSDWYFEGGGLLMSVATRDAYFMLARALTRASLPKELIVPMFPNDAEYISVQKVNYYRNDRQPRRCGELELWIPCIERGETGLQVYVLRISSAYEQRNSHYTIMSVSLLTHDAPSFPILITHEPQPI